MFTGTRGRKIVTAFIAFVLIMAFPLMSSAATITGLTVEIYDVVDDSNVIVYVEPHSAIGFELANEGITVTDSDGVQQTIIHAASAFLELGAGPEVLSTFRIEFETPLAPGTYTVSLANFTDDVAGTNTYETATVDFTIEGEATSGDPSESSSEDSPSTGDSSPIAFVLMMSSLVLAGTAVIMISRKRRITE